MLYPNDRIEGHVYLTLNGKHFISAPYYPVERWAIRKFIRKIAKKNHCKIRDIKVTKVKGFQKAKLFIL